MAGASVKEPEEWDRVLVRHVVVSRRGDINHLELLIKVPFEDHSMSSALGDGTRADVYGRPRGRWMIAARFKDQNWAALFTNVGTSHDLFEGNAKHRRLEVAWIGYREDRGGWFCRLRRGGKQAVDFTQPHAGDTAPKLEAAELPDDFLNGCSSGAESFERLCAHFELAPKQREIRAGKKAFQVIGVRGKAVKTGLAGYLLYHGPQIAEGEEPAAEKLAEAIERCDPQAIRAAVAEGASLEHLPGTSVSPLLSALFRCGRKRWDECAKLLIELGSPVDGWPGDDPPVVSATESFVGDYESLAILKLLVEQGADVNAAGGHGDLALFNAVVHRRKGIIEFLLSHGADPHAKTQTGQTIVEWLKVRMESDLQQGFSQYAEILTLLTGEEVEQPGLLQLTDELKRENQRFEDCLRGKLMTSVIMVDGQPARFERVGCYLDIVSQSNPAWSTGMISKRALEDLDRAESADATDGWSLEQGIHAAADLLAMKHLQFAGAPADESFIGRGASVALRFFEAEVRRSRPFSNHWCVDELLRGLLLNMLVDRWDGVASLCATLTSGLATSKARMSDDLPRELAKLLLVVASHFRERAIRGSASMIEKIRKSRRQHPKLLLKVWNAVEAGQQSAYEEALVNSLEYTVKQYPEASSFYELRRFLAWPESILLMIAEREGLSLPELPMRLSDRLLTSDWR